MVYARNVGERTLTYDFAEGLLNDNLLLVDRETRSVWSQLSNAAVGGELEGTAMQVLPAIQTTWSTWRSLHPDTRVMVVADEKGHPYFYRNRRPGTPPPGKPPAGHDISVLGLGLYLNGEARFYPLERLLALDRALVDDTLGGRKIRIHVGPDGLSAWAEDADGNLLPAVMAYRQGWRDFNPQTSVFGESPSP